MSNIEGIGEVILIRENEDGSADYQFIFPPEVLDALTRLGIMTAIKAGIDEAKQLNPEEFLNETDTQARREWVGLTDEEKGWCAAPTYAETIERVEAKLKEKNES